MEEMKRSSLNNRSNESDSLSLMLLSVVNNKCKMTSGVYESKNVKSIALNTKITPMSLLSRKDRHFFFLNQIYLRQ